MALSQKKIQQKRNAKKAKRRKAKSSPKPRKNSNVVPYVSGGMDEQDKRIIDILAPNSELDEPPCVNNDTLSSYFSYIETNLPEGTKVTGIEDLGYFGWEEKYTFGAGSEEEYKKLREEYGSCEDTYEILEVAELDDTQGILVNVKRINDGKKFTIPLQDLEGCGNDAQANQLIDDYVCWVVNN